MPNIGNYENIIVTTIIVSINDTIQANDKILTVESGKVSLDVVSPYSGTITEIYISVGQVIENDFILFKIKTNEQKVQETVHKLNIEKDKIQINNMLHIYASPNIRRLARKLKLDLKSLNGSGINNRIIKNDIINIASDRYNRVIQKISLTRKKYISNKILVNSWSNIPHVTQFSEIDISSLLQIYINEKKKLKKKKINLTLLPFIIKAITKTLIKYPYFNSSLYDKDKVIIKKYYNIGIVTATKDGLIIPVIKNVNIKSIFDINNELLLNKKKIENNNLTPEELTGGSFSISNLGSYTNGFFTPIIKYPEVAILGISRYQLKPIIQHNKELCIKTLLPISLSYDHRIIDGLDCINFIKSFHKNLNEIKSIYNE